MKKLLFFILAAFFSLSLFAQSGVGFSSPTSSNTGHLKTSILSPGTGTATIQISVSAYIKDAGELMGLGEITYIIGNKRIHFNLSSQNSGQTITETIPLNAPVINFEITGANVGISGGWIYANAQIISATCPILTNNFVFCSYTYP